LRTAVRAASPDYFKTLGIPLMKGRTFQGSDNNRAAPVAIVNRTLAHHYWGDENPIGKRLWGDDDIRTTVVGVVGDVKELGLDHETFDELYIPQGQAPFMTTALVRTAEEGLTVANEMRRAVRSLEPDTAIPSVETLEQARSDSMASPRVMTDLLGIFAGLALAIAAFGIGGILALAVNQRLNEIGIRIALGAKPGDVLAMIFQKGMLLVAVGLAIGVVSSIVLTRLMKGLLFQVEPTDPATFIGVSLVLALVALLACYVPARRALRVDPLLALRRE
jgi:putative ABC transport system permease protein